jgi:hypothetical protein
MGLMIKKFKQTIKLKQLIKHQRKIIIIYQVLTKLQQNTQINLQIKNLCP